MGIVLIDELFLGQFGQGQETPTGDEEQIGAGVRHEHVGLIWQ